MMAENYVNLDLVRRTRIGLDEAVLCGHKSANHIIEILDQVAAARRRMLLTRLTETVFNQLPRHHRENMDYDKLSRTAFYGCLPTDKTAQPHGREVAILCAGTSDAFVAREAARTLAFDGVGCLEIGDIGVAGLWRLLEKQQAFVDCKIVICVAGMDAALPSVVGGLVSATVIAVPTSTGYGAANGGNTALAACLSSCAPGVLVTNIDNGYGAACAALRTLNSFARPESCSCEDKSAIAGAARLN